MSIDAKEEVLGVLIMVHIASHKGLAENPSFFREF